MKNKYNTIIKNFLIFLMLFTTFCFAQGQSNISLYREMTHKDPNLKVNWDWTDDSDYTLYYLTSNIGGTINWITKKMPYYDQYGPAFRDLFSFSNDPDIQEVDGWVLLARDFGTPTSAPLLPWFMLYNKYRGVIRWFFVNTYFDNTYSHFLGTMKHQDAAGTTTAVLTWLDHEKGFLDDYDGDVVQTYIGDMAPGQWAFVDFMVKGYDPNIQENAAFTFSIQGVLQSDITLEGLITTEENQAIANKKSTGPNLGMDDLQKAIKYYNSAESSINDLKKKTYNADGSVKDKWYAGILDGIFTSGVTNIVPGLSAVAGFLGSVFGASGGSSAMPVPMPIKFTASHQLSGEIVSNQPLLYFSILAPGAPNVVLPPGTFRTVYDEPLGIFNLTTQPIVNYIIDEHEWWAKWLCWNSDTRRTETWYQYVMDYYLRYSLADNIQFINQPDLSITSIKIAYYDSGKDKLARYYNPAILPLVQFMNQARVADQRPPFNLSCYSIYGNYDFFFLPGVVSVAVTYTTPTRGSHTPESFFFFKTYNVKLIEKNMIKPIVSADNLNLTSRAAGQSHDYIALRTINVSGDYQINDGQSDTFTAGQSINFQDGFIAHSGSSVSANIPKLDGLAKGSGSELTLEDLLALHFDRSFDKVPASSKMKPSNDSENNKVIVVTDYALKQNYPNPFNPVTNIIFDIPEQSDISLRVFDIHGKVVAELFNGRKEAGRYTGQFDGSDLSSGVYFYEIIANATSGERQSFQKVKKMMLVK